MIFSIDKGANVVALVSTEIIKSHVVVEHSDEDLIIGYYKD